MTQFSSRLTYLRCWQTPSEGDDSPGTFIIEEGTYWPRTSTNDSLNGDIGDGTIASAEKVGRDKDRVSEEIPPNSEQWGLPEDPPVREQ
ncbi:hypothetical protein N7454_006146 [Penicillium verhagenii]|nr:hypothetical protein N7454_006146 [Penicillium verhagenii]